MKCGDLTNDLLAEPAVPDVREHLATCADCRARAAELGALAGDLAELGRALPSSENPALVRRIQSRLQRKNALRHRVQTSSAGRWFAAAAAAALVVIALAVATRQPPPQEPPIVATPEKQTIETAPLPVPPPLPKPPPREPEPVPAPKEPVPTLKPPEPPPTVVPEPKPPEPEKPAPKPVEPEKPRVAPTEVKPTRVFIAIANIEGTLELNGRKIEKGAEWEKDATLRAGDRLSRVTLADGTRLTLRPHAELQLQGIETLAMERGEIFCEVIPGAGRRLAVVTPDATIQVTGTQFAVKRTDHTEVVVAAGEVKVSNDKGESILPAGTGATARKSSAPTKPRIADVDAMITWRRAADPPETPRFRFDFEDGRKPIPWQNAKVVAGPVRGLNKFCLEGSPGIDLDFSKVDKRVYTVKGALRLRFRCYATSGDSFQVQFSDDRVKDNFKYDVAKLVHNRWEVFDVPLSDFYLMADGAARIQEGDRFNWLNINIANAMGPVYFDDIELVEVLK